MGKNPSPGSLREPPSPRRGEEWRPSETVRVHQEQKKAPTGTLPILLPGGEKGPKDGRDTRLALEPRRAR